MANDNTNTQATYQAPTPTPDPDLKSLDSFHPKTLFSGDRGRGSKIEAK